MDWLLSDFTDSGGDDYLKGGSGLMNLTVFHANWSLLGNGSLDEGDLDYPELDEDYENVLHALLGCILAVLILMLLIVIWQMRQNASCWRKKLLTGPAIRYRPSRTNADLLRLVV